MFPNMMETTTMNKCTKTVKGWLGSEREITDHDFKYKDTETRVCEKCGQKEIYFGSRGYGGTTIEDWRKAK